MSKEAEALVDVAAFAEPQEAGALIEQLSRAIESLQQLRDLLLMQAEVAQLRQPAYAKVEQPFLIESRRWRCETESSAAIGSFREV